MRAFCAYPGGDDARLYSTNNLDVTPTKREGKPAVLRAFESCGTHHICDFGVNNVPTLVAGFNLPFYRVLV